MLTTQFRQIQYYKSYSTTSVLPPNWALPTIQHQQHTNSTF